MAERELDQQHKPANAGRCRAETGLYEVRQRIANPVHRIEEDDDAPRALTARPKNVEAERGSIHR